MKVTAFRLSDRAVAIQPSAEARARDENVELGTASADQQGWLLLCPQAFEATWNGGPAPEDIAIHWDADAPAEAAFVVSHLGAGRLSFYPDYQVKTDGACGLWARGPINAPKDGIVALESLIDCSIMPCMVIIHWQFTRAGHTIRFEAGEPFGLLLLNFSVEQSQAALEVIEPQVDVEAFEQSMQQMLDAPALKDTFVRLRDAQPAPEQPDEIHVNEPTHTPDAWASQLVNPPPVSCICPTYGRVELLEEAIYSFLQQDYPGQKELIVLNDYDLQTLEFDHPEVRIVNLPTRYHSVGEKYKAAVALASHDLIFVWHDDDIYLPHRLSFSVAHCDAGTSFFKADKAWFWNKGELSGPEKNNFHGGSCWRRGLYNKAHGYPQIGNGYDVEFEQRCRAVDADALRIESIQPADIYYIYRWIGTNSYHFSGSGANGQEHQNVAAHIEQQAASGQIPQGHVQLQPRWKSDYGTLAQACLATLPVSKGDDENNDEDVPFPPPFHVIPPPPLLPADQMAHLFKGDYAARISVILPAANESVLLKRTVEQFVATLPENSEVIVVDNGSTDHCADFLVDGSGFYENVHLIRTPDLLGVSGARNRGLSQARGEIVVFADAHLDLPEHWWPPIVSMLQRPEVGVVGPGIGVMGLPQSSIACGQRIAEPALRVEWLPWQGLEPFQSPTLGGGFMAMRHDTLKRAGAFDAGMPQWGSEDLEICVRYWLLGYEVWVAPAVTVMHYFRKSNPYKVEWGAVTHNLLRVALLHFNEARLARVISALKSHNNFAQAMAFAVGSDVWQKRAEFAGRRAHDDDWFFEKFAESCDV